MRIFSTIFIAATAFLFISCKKDQPAENTNPSSIYSVVVKSIPSGAFVYADKDSVPKITPDVYSNKGGNVVFRFSREACKDTTVNVFIKNNDSVVVKLRDSVVSLLSYELTGQKVNLTAQFNTNVQVTFYSIKTPSASYSFIADTAMPYLKDIPGILRQSVNYVSGLWDISIRGHFAADTSFKFNSRASINIP